VSQKKDPDIQHLIDCIERDKPRWAFDGLMHGLSTLLLYFVVVAILVFAFYLLR